jgi:hypothetical protein
MSFEFKFLSKQTRKLMGIGIRDFEVVIHKVDGDSGVGDERKISEYIQRTIQESITDHLRVAKLDIPMAFYVTSIIALFLLENFRHLDPNSRTIKKLV